MRVYIHVWYNQIKKGIYPQEINSEKRTAKYYSSYLQVWGLMVNSPVSFPFYCFLSPYFFFHWKILHKEHTEFITRKNNVLTSRGTLWTHKTTERALETPEEAGFPIPSEGHRHGGHCGASLPCQTRWLSAQAGAWELSSTGPWEPELEPSQHCQGQETVVLEAVGKSEGSAEA